MHANSIPTVNPITNVCEVLIYIVAVSNPRFIWKIKKRVKEVTVIRLYDYLVLPCTCVKEGRDRNFSS